jgi:hypothetical protein
MSSGHDRVQSLSPAVPAARADLIALIVVSPFQSAAAGNRLTFDATVSNTGSTVIYLNGDTVYNGAPYPPSLRLPQLPELQTSRKGLMWFDWFGIGVSPVFGLLIKNGGRP